MIPQATVKNGSQILGDAFLSTRLLGNSLEFYQSKVSQIFMRGVWLLIAPADIKQIVHCQSDIVLVVSDANVTFEAEDLCIPDVGAIKERAQEK